MSQLARKPRIRRLERRRHQRVAVAVGGRYMLADRTEHLCTSVDISPGGLRVRASQRGALGERVVCYLDVIGRVEGQITRLLPDGFAMSISATLRKRDRLASQLTWLANRHELNLPEDRRHERVVPRNAATTLKLPTGQTIVVRTVDVSMSGAALVTDIPIELGTIVIVGSRKAWVTRVFENGIAVEFEHPLRPEVFGPEIVL